MSSSSYCKTKLGMMNIMESFPVGSDHGSGNEYYAAKARIAAIFMERKLGISKESIEEKLCKIMGIEKLGKKKC